MDSDRKYLQLSILLKETLYLLNQMWSKHVDDVSVSRVATFINGKKI